MLLGEARRSGEDASGVGSVECARFTRWVEELGECLGVLFKVVDGFMGRVGLSGVLVQVGHGDHAMDSPRIRESQLFSLDSEN